MSARKQLAEQLTILLPKVTVIDTEEFPPKITRPTLMIRQRGYSPAPSNPLGTLVAGFIITIASHISDMAKAENALDNLVPDVILALFQIPSATWTQANKVRVVDTYLGYDIEISVPVNVN